MNDCIFCKIVSNDIPSEKVFESEDILAFKDIEPKAPVHILIIPKKHIDGIDAPDADASITGKLVSTAAMLAERFHLDSGYRIVSNVGTDGGQTVRHLHFHLLGGTKLGTDLG